MSLLSGFVRGKHGFWNKKFGLSTRKIDKNSVIFSKDENRFELDKDRKDRISEKIIAHIIKSSKQNKTVINS